MQSNLALVVQSEQNYQQFLPTVYHTTTGCFRKNETQL